MLAQPMVAMHQLTKFTQQKVLTRKQIITQRIREICPIIQDILKEVETQEPRFISTMHENNGHLDGMHVISGCEFEIILYLNQMGVFNFVDDGSIPGSAVLKLSDGRKRSMSLWVEFITASGYLSSRKIRSRFQTLVAGAIDKTKHRDIVKVIGDSSEVKLRIRDRYIVQITTAFRCAGIWPRSASQWPVPGRPWPQPTLIAEVKTEGFDLLSKEVLQGGVPAKSGSNQGNGGAGGAGTNGGSLSPTQPHGGGSSTPQGGQGGVTPQQQATLEGDAWVMHFGQAEDLLLAHDCRRRAFSILKTIKDLYLDPAIPNSPISTYILKTILLHECDKHANWDDVNLGDRLIGIFLQLISCLQCRRCPHYFVPNLDLIQGKSHETLDKAAKVVWRLVRDMILNPNCLDLLC